MNRISAFLLGLLLAQGCVKDSSQEWQELTDRYFSYEDRGSYDSALFIARDALSIANQYFPENDYRTAQSLNNLAEMYRELGEFDKTISLYKQAIEIYQVNSAFRNGVVFYTNLGLAYYDLREFEKSEASLIKSIEILKSWYPPCDNAYHTPLSTLGLIELRRKNIDSARKYFKKANDCYEDQEVQDPMKLGGIYENWAHLLMFERNYDSANFFLRKSLKIQEEFHSNDHPDLGSIYGLLAVYFHVMKKYDSAELYYKKGLQSRGQDNLRSLTTAENLARLYLDTGDSLKRAETLRIIQLID